MRVARSWREEEEEEEGGAGVCASVEGDMSLCVREGNVWEERVEGRVM